MLVQPGLELAVGFHLFLQGFKRLDLGRQIGQFGRLIVDCLLLVTTLLVQARCLFFEFLQACTGLFGQFFGLSQLRLQIQQALFVWGVQGIAISNQALTAHGQLARLVFNVALICGQHLNLLLDLNHTAALFVGFGLRLAQSFFQIWQGLGLLFNLSGQSEGLIFGLEGLFCQRLQLGLGLNLTV